MTKRLRRRREHAELVASAHIPFDVVIGNEAEKAFIKKAAAKGDIYRHGWPDFLLELDGRMIGVEVKRGADRLSERQVKMFAALERAGIDVFVWNPRFPDRLTRWRSYSR